MEEPEIARINRVLKRATMRRDECIRRIEAMHELALKCEAELSLITQLSFLVDEVDGIWKEFTAESNTVIDCLIDVGRESEYPVGQVADLRNLISICRATVNRHILSDQINVSVRRESKISVPEQGSVRSLNLNDDRESQAGSIASGVARSRTALDVNVPLGSVRSGHTTTRTTTHVKPARLPEIPLPTFNGDIFKWPMFRDRFMSMVDQRSTIADIDKFYYLTGCLRDKALEAIAGIPVCGDNYSLAWASLTARFDKPRLVASSLLDKLLTAPKSSNENLTELNKFLSILTRGSPYSIQ